MRLPIPRLTRLLTSVLVGVSATALADGPVCSIEAPPLHIKVSAEPDDGSWGPTLEVVVEDADQPLTRLIAQESRPVEACWWQVMKGLGRPALVIGVGAMEPEGAGALVFVWREGRLDRHPVPEFSPKGGGAYRFIARDGVLEAHPAPNPAGLPADKPAYRLSGRAWVPVPVPREPSAPVSNAEAGKTS